MTVIAVIAPAMVRDVLELIGDAIPRESLVISIAAASRSRRWRVDSQMALLSFARCRTRPRSLGRNGSAVVGSAPCGGSTEPRPELLGAVGKVAVVPESQQDAVTAVSGSEPAYFSTLLER